MHREYRCTSCFDFFCKFDSLFSGVEASYLTGDRDFKILFQGPNNSYDLICFVEKVCSVASLFGADLRAPKININRITLIFDISGCLEKSLRIISSKLYKKWPVLIARVKILGSQLVISYK